MVAMAVPAFSMKIAVEERQVRSADILECRGQDD